MVKYSNREENSLVTAATKKIGMKGMTEMYLSCLVHLPGMFE